MDDDKRRRIRLAAMEVFLRYGYRKVTMDDIARGVGVSRPALYLVFPNKEAVFRDVVEAGLSDLLEQIEAGLPSRTTLEDELSHVFDVTSIGSFERVAKAPAAAELMNASFDFVRDVFDRYEQRLCAIITRLIRAAVTDADALKPPAEARARVMLAAAHGFKSTAKNVGEMRALIGDLIEMTVAGLPVAGRPSRSNPRHRAAAKRKATRR
jgi:AcrR family transcriptional regulator